MMKNMMNKLRGRKEVVVEKKGLFGRTKVEITITDRKGNVLETKVEKKERESRPARPERRSPMTMEAKLEARKRNREAAKLEVEVQIEERKINKKAIVAGVGAAAVVGAGAFSTSRYKKVVEKDNSETKETLNLDEIKDILD